MSWKADCRMEIEQEQRNTEIETDLKEVETKDLETNP
jgi:hypothetical protein